MKSKPEFKICFAVLNFDYSRNFLEIDFSKINFEQKSKFWAKIKKLVGNFNHVKNFFGQKKKEIGVN